MAECFAGQTYSGWDAGGAIGGAAVSPASPRASCTATVGRCVPCPGQGMALREPPFYLLGKAVASEKQPESDAFLVMDFRQGFLSSFFNLFLTFLTLRMRFWHTQGAWRRIICYIQKCWCSPLGEAAFFASSLWHCRQLSNLIAQSTKKHSKKVC